MSQVTEPGNIPPTVEPEQFFAVDIRSALVTAVDEFPEARRPAYRIRLDLGPLGERVTSAQITNVGGAGGTVGLPQFINQWKGRPNALMVSGMVMVGDMFNQGLKARVDALCRDLAGLLRGGEPVFTEAAAPTSPRRAGRA